MICIRWVVAQVDQMYFRWVVAQVDEMYQVDVAQVDEMYQVGCCSGG